MSNAPLRTTYVYTPPATEWLADEWLAALRQTRIPKPAKRLGLTIWGAITRSGNPIHCSDSFGSLGALEWMARDAGFLLHGFGEAGHGWQAFALALFILEREGWVRTEVADQRVDPSPYGWRLIEATDPLRQREVVP